MEKEELLIKEIYKIVIFILKIMEIKFPYDRAKRIIFDTYIAESEEEHLIKNIADTYRYLINNEFQYVNKEKIKKAYYLLTNKLLEDNYASIIEKFYYKNKHKSIVELVSYMHFLILEMGIEKGEIFAFIIENYLMKKNGRNPIVIYDSYIDMYRQIIEKKDKEKLTILFFMTNRNYSKKEKTYTSKEEIIEILDKNKTEIIQRFNIKELYLFGSFANDNQTCVSDIDLVIEFEKGLSIYQESIKIKQLKERLNSILPREVDILNLNNLFKKYDLGDVDRMIKII